MPGAAGGHVPCAALRCGRLGGELLAMPLTSPLPGLSVKPISSGRRGTKVFVCGGGRGCGVRSFHLRPGPRAGGEVGRASE